MQLSINHLNQLQPFINQVIAERQAVLYLLGDLGTGKTTFVREALRCLGHVGHVPSPSYALMHEYLLPRARVIHADLYRLQDTEALLDLDVREWPQRADYVFIEWPERGGTELPPPDFIARFHLSQAGRLLEFSRVKA